MFEILMLLVGKAYYIHILNTQLYILHFVVLTSLYLWNICFHIKPCNYVVHEELVDTKILSGLHFQCHTIVATSFSLFRYRRQTHVTPKSYLSFLDGYKSVYQQKYSEIGELARRMNTGLAKLIEASESVDQLSKELIIKEKELAVANIKADKVGSNIMAFCPNISFWHFDLCPSYSLHLQIISGKIVRMSALILALHLVYCHILPNFKGNLKSFGRLLYFCH